MDYSKVSTEDLKNYQAGNTAGISTEGLRLLTAQQPAQAPATPAQLRGQKIDSYLAETDKMLGLTPGTSARQINVESRFDDAAHNIGSGARGISQVIEATRASLSKRFGRELDSHNTDDALMMHREVMRENMGKWGNESDALRAYNSGWVPSKWGNDETTNYIKQIVGEDGSFELPSKGGGVNPASRAYPPAPKDMKETALNSNQDFLAASEQMYMGVEERNFLGTDEDLAEWGKKYIWDFNNNLGRMAQRTTQVMSGTQEEKEAMLYMMEAFDNTDISFAGTWRSIKAASYDPTTYASFAALGIGTVGKVLTAAAAKEGVKKALLTALGRTGIVAGVETGIIGAAESTMKQSIRVDAGAQAEFSNAQLAIDTSVSAALGVVVGSAGDLLAQKMAPAASRKLSEFRKWIRPDAAKETASSTVGNTVEVTYNPASGLPLSPEDAAKVAQLRSGKDPRLPEVFVHGTTPNNAASIRASGVINAEGGSRQYSYSEFGRKSTYFTAEDGWWLDADAANNGRAVAYDAQVGISLSPEAKISVVSTPAELDALAQRVGLKDGQELIDELFVDGLNDVAGNQKLSKLTLDEAFDDSFKRGIESLKKNGWEGLDKLETFEQLHQYEVKNGLAGEVSLEEAKSAVEKSWKLSKTYEADTFGRSDALTQKLIDNDIDGIYITKEWSEVSVAPDQLALFRPELARIAGETAAEAPTPRVSTTPAAPPSIILPNDLAKAKPRWKTSQIVFESDIDKALYITAQQSPSKRDLDYRNFLREHGYSETDINVGGVELRQRMNAIGAKLNAGESFVVPKGEGSKWVDPASLGPSTGPASSNQVSSNRRQKGRQWVDDLPPVTPANPEAAARLTVPPSGTGQRGTPRTHEASRANGSVVERQLDNMTNEELHGVLEAERLGTSNRSIEDYATVNLGVQFHATKVGDELDAALTKLKGVLTPDEYAKTLARITQLEDRLIPLQLADEAWGTTAGSLLNQRKIGEKVIPTIAKLMDEGKITRPEAETLYQRLHAAARQDAIVKQAMFPHDEAIAAAIKVGDSSEILRLQVVKRMELEALVETIIPKAGSFMARVTEGAISNVLSGTSLIVNVAYSAPKTLLIPALQALISDPLKRATRIRVAGAYSSMASTVSHSFTAAMDVWRYEQLILTRDSFKLLDGPMANTGRFGGALRVIPRLMATMDEFLTQINYVGFIGGRAREKAYLEAVEQKMSPKLTKAYMKAETAKAIAGAFAVNSGETLLQPIVNKGVNRGFRGEELNEWVMKEVSRAHALEPGNNKEALEFARDMLYQRKWSKENFWSKGASKYEELISEYPGLRLVIGQLFFRTPIRVFEEGVRLTPGLQFAAPGFMKDLAGLNGETRQLRAQGEALMSTAIAGWTLSQYARGEITGAGGSDSYKQERLKADTGGDGAYTLGDTDSKWNYRNYDPVAFPIKVMVTAMELMDKMHTRQAQGDAPDLKQEQQVMAYMAVGVQSIAMAIKDANLMAGVAMAIDTGVVMMDPEKGLNQATMKYVGERLSWVLPSTMTKIAKQNDPTLKDPATYWQMVEERLAGIYIDISDVKSSYSYDIFGNVRTTKDTGRLWNTFSTTTQEEREGDLTPSMIYVGKELDKLSQITGAKFETPIKFAELGDLDMRTLMTADGKETLYDRWNRFYRSRDPAERVAQILRMNLSSGTFKNKGPMVAEVQGVLKLYRELAFYDMRKTEQVVLDRHRKEMRDKASAESGRTGLDWFN